MIITPELMKACGSGANPNDKECVEGYNYFLEIVEDHNPDTKAFNSLEETIRVVHNFIYEKEFSEKIKNAYLGFLLKLKYDPAAIEMGQHGEWTDEYRFKTFDDKYVHGSLEEIKDLRDKYLTDYFSALDPYKEVNVMKHLALKTGGSKSVSISSKDFLSEEHKYTVFIRSDGVHTGFLSAEEVPEAVTKEFEKLKNKLSSKTAIQRKIVDKEEGYEAWSNM